MKQPYISETVQCKSFDNMLILLIKLYKTGSGIFTTVLKMFCKRSVYLFVSYTHKNYIPDMVFYSVRIVFYCLSI